MDHLAGVPPEAFSKLIAEANVKGAEAEQRARDRGVRMSPTLAPQAPATADGGALLDALRNPRVPE